MNLSKMTKVAGVGAAVILLSAGAALAATATASVNVRTGPGTQFRSIDTLYAGERVGVIDQEGGWCAIEKSGPNGWVSCRYLTSDNSFDARPHGPPVAVGKFEQSRSRIVAERQRLALHRFGALRHLLELVRRERIEPQHLGARQQRRIELEARVLGGGANKRDGPILHHRQEAVLLGAIEAMDFIDEEQCPVAAEALEPRFLEYLLQIGDAGEDGRNLDRKSVV